MSLIDRLKANTGSKLINKLKSHETGQGNTGRIAPGREPSASRGLRGLAGSQEQAPRADGEQLQRPAPGVNDTGRPVPRGDR